MQKHHALDPGLPQSTISMTLLIRTICPNPAAIAKNKMILGFGISFHALVGQWCCPLLGLLSLAGNSFWQSRIWKSAIK